MRIGEVNQDNYNEYLKLLDIKDKKISNNVIVDRGTSKRDPFGNERVIGSDGYETGESVLRRMIKLGYVEEGMYVKEGDTSWNKIVPVPDDIKDNLIEIMRRQFLTNGNGLTTPEDGDEIGALYKELRKNISPSERLSFTWTLEQIRNQEGQRLMDYVRANMPPDWKPGDPIDPDVLERAVSGEHVDVKA